MASTQQKQSEIVNSIVSVVSEQYGSIDDIKPYLQAPIYHAVLLKMIKGFTLNSAHSGRLMAIPSQDMISFYKYGTRYPWREDFDLGYTSNEPAFADYLKFLNECLEYGFEINVHLKPDKFSMNIQKLVLDNPNGLAYNITLAQLQDLIRLDPQSFYFANVALAESNWKTFCDKYEIDVLKKWFNLYLATPWINVFPFQKQPDTGMWQVHSSNVSRGALDNSFCQLEMINTQSIKLSLRCPTNMLQALDSYVSNWKTVDVISSDVVNSITNQPTVIKKQSSDISAVASQQHRQTVSLLSQYHQIILDLLGKINLWELYSE